MLRVGLSGGIGSGKSTVSDRLAELGALVIDADVLAREVVAVGSEGLAAVAERFGPQVIADNGSLDRAALGSLVFAGGRGRADLEAITHPRIASRTAALMGGAEPGRIIVHDVALLVEKDYGPRYHLVVIVGADEDTRVQRLVRARGMSEDDSRARVAAQATDEQRRAAADIWLDNTGTLDDLTGAVDRLWSQRLTRFNTNLTTGAPGHRSETRTLSRYDDTWPAQAARLSGRLRRALDDAGAGEAVVGLQHIGSTSVPGLIAENVIDLQVVLGRLEDGDDPAVVAALAAAGYPRIEPLRQDDTLPWEPEPVSWCERLHGHADPHRAVNLHLRGVEDPGWRHALLFRDWLRAHPQEAAAYARLKKELAARGGVRTSTDGASRGAAHPRYPTDDYTRDKGRWIVAASERARAWAERTGWEPEAISR